MAPRNPPKNKRPAPAEITPPGSPAVRAAQKAREKISEVSQAATKTVKKTVKKVLPAKNKASAAGPSRSQQSSTGEVDPSTGFVKVVPSSKRSRDIGAQIRAVYSNIDEMRRDTTNFDVVHSRPLTVPADYQHQLTVRLWIDYFTIVLGSRTAADATLAKDAPFPELAQVEQFVKACATTGKSEVGVAEAKCWTLGTTHSFLGRIFSILKRRGTVGPTAYERAQLLHTVTEWKLKDRIIPSHKKTKRTTIEQDFVEISAAALNTNVPIATNVARVQMHAFCALLYTHGSRPSSIVKAPHHNDTPPQFLAWGDLEFVCYGWDEGAGLGWQVSIKRRKSKGMREEDSLFISTSMRSLGRDNTHLDPIPAIFALAIERDVFTIDVEQEVLVKGKMIEFPITLQVKKKMRKEPVLLSSNLRGPLTCSGATSILATITKYLDCKRPVRFLPGDYG
ncbi:hypothetical protein B0H12DRAFT_695923 [Mycena haematopus]|nr:hypothetical protein B0H12DRAFT_695923 [Mycena haematopus]